VWERTIALLAERGVSPEALRQPAEEILAQVAFGNLIAGAQPDLHDMFASLLATDLDSGRDRPHPAFAEVIRQLSRAEAVVLRHLASVGHSQPMSETTSSVTYSDGTKQNTSTPVPGADLTALLPGMTQENFVSLYENLMRLQLATITPLSKSGKPSPRVLELTRFGKGFCSACF
jgi:hypothetical protein